MVARQQATEEKYHHILKVEWPKEHQTKVGANQKMFITSNLSKVQTVKFRQWIMNSYKGQW